MTIRVPSNQPARWPRLRRCAHSVTVVLTGVLLSGCGLLRGLFGGFGTDLFGEAGPRIAGVVQVHLDNQSGYPADVIAEYTIHENEVRTTRRMLAVTGPESSDDILATTTLLLKINARVADLAATSQPATSQPATSQPATSQPFTQVVQLHPGDPLLSLELTWGVDFRNGDMLVITIPPPKPPAGDFLDCNQNGIPDDQDIGGGGSRDCNCNLIPDECDLADGVLHDANPVDSVPDECVHCPPLDVVFIMDTSGSMDDEAMALCAFIDSVVADLTSKGIVVHATLLGINENPDAPYDCLTGNVADLLGGQVPGVVECCPAISSNEDWGPATSIVAARFAWSPGAVRVVIPISDEGPYAGSPCLDPGSDRDSINAAIADALANQVHVSPIVASGADECVRQLAMDLASHTGGTASFSTAPATDLATALRTALLSVCSSTGCP